MKPRTKLLVFEFILFIFIFVLAYFEFIHSVRDYIFVQKTAGTILGTINPYSSFTRPFTHFYHWGNNDESKFILKGENNMFGMNDAYKKAQKDIYERYPDSNIWQMNYLRFWHAELKPAELYEMAKKEPDNAKYDYFIISNALEKLVHWEANKMLIDFSIGDKIFKRFLEATKKTYSKSYTEDILKMKSQAVSANDITGGAANILLTQHYLASTPDYTVFFSNLVGYINFLIEKNEFEKAVVYLDAFKPFIRQHAEDISSCSDVFALNSYLRRNTNIFAYFYNKMEEFDKSNELQNWSYRTQYAIVNNLRFAPYSASESELARISGEIATTEQRSYTTLTERIFDLRCWIGMIFIPFFAVLSLILLYSRYSKLTIYLTLFFSVILYPTLIGLEKLRFNSDELLKLENGNSLVDTATAMKQKAVILDCLDAPPDRTPLPVADDDF